MIVIVILAALAAVAAPKFINISGDATKNVLKSISGDIQTALTLVEAKRQIDGSTTSIQYGSDSLSLRAGFPVADLKTLNIFLDIKTPKSYTRYWRTDQKCDFDDFCLVGDIDFANKYKNAPQIEGFTSGEAVYIWPKGYNLRYDQCFSYYVNSAINANDNTAYTFTGAVTDGC